MELVVFIVISPEIFIKCLCYRPGPWREAGEGDWRFLVTGGKGCDSSGLVARAWKEVAVGFHAGEGGHPPKAGGKGGLLEGAPP